MTPTPALAGAFAGSCLALWLAERRRHAAMFDAYTRIILHAAAQAAEDAQVIRELQALVFRHEREAELARRNFATFMQLSDDLLAQRTVVRGAGGRFTVVR